MAIINGDHIDIRKGTLLLIVRGETHEIRNLGQEPLLTVNIYVPPAYSNHDNELAPGECS